MAKKENWQEIKRSIIDTLDIRKEYEELGVKFTSNKVTRRGTIYCRRDDNDKSPSCEVFVEGPAKGRWKDYKGSGKTLAIWDYATSIVGLFGGDYFTALKHYANKAGVKLPESAEENALSKLEISNLSYSMLSAYEKGKPGISAQAVKDAGAMAARWPKDLPAELQQVLIAYPMYGQHLLDLDPTGWHVVDYRGRKFDKYQGKDKPPIKVKVLTIGERGLMNASGLKAIGEAKVIWITEGVTDMQAVHTSLLNALSQEKVDGKILEHVVVSAGGTSYHPLPEWAPIFAGKECRVLFDVGDADGAGESGAKVWVTFLLPIASSVKNIRLPERPEGGKIDARDWLNGLKDNVRDETLPTHSYYDLCDLAESFDSIKGDDKDEQLSPGEAILKCLKLVVIGEHENSQQVEVFSEETRKVATIKDLDKFTTIKLMQICGNELVGQYINTAKEPVPGKFQISEVKMAIAGQASRKAFHGTNFLGCGAWLVGDTPVLVQAKEAAVIKNGIVEKLAVPLYEGNVLDLSIASGRWFNHDVMQRHLNSAKDRFWCEKVFEEAEGIFKKWNWKQKPAPRLVASLVICSWIQTFWQWRPQVYINGSSDTGKSYLANEVLNLGIFGPVALYVQKPTEAAIRQHMKHHAKVLIVDEFEHDIHRQRVLELLRVSSRGGKTIRGSSDQKGVESSLKHLPWLVSIETGLRKTADKNRFIIFDMNEIPPEKRGDICLPSEEYLHSLSLKLLAVGIVNFKEASVIAQQLNVAKLYEGVPGRVVENFSIPCAMISAIYKHEQELAVALMRKTLEYWEFSDQSKKDEIELLNTILSSLVQVDSREKETVSALIRRGSESVALRKVGIAVVNRRSKVNLDEQRCIFFVPEMVERSLIEYGNPFHGISTRQFLARLKGAECCQQWLPGDTRRSGVSVPVKTIEDAIGLYGGEEAPEIGVDYIEVPPEAVYL